MKQSGQVFPLWKHPSAHPECAPLMSKEFFQFSQADRINHHVSLAFDRSFWVLAIPSAHYPHFISGDCCRFSIAVINTMIKSNLGKKRFILSYSSQDIPHHWRKSGQKLIAETWGQELKQNHRGVLLTGLLLVDCSPTLLSYTARTPCPRVALPLVSRAFLHKSLTKKNALIDLSTGQHEGGMFSLRFPLPRWS